MTYYPTDFFSSQILGANISDLQVKLIHSYIAGNASFKAFSTSYRDLNIYLANIAIDNNLELHEAP